mmetsp:Transcript_51508/g.162827  ORF Transcript_51508/g.162827 Transcript_51508/m.162827 type:complete len:377 (-) Transcript_51508:781-1911(-)
MRAARFAHDDRLRPGAILKRALVDRLAERAGAVGGVAAAALRHVLVRHVAPVLLLVVDLPDGLLQAGPAVLDHQVRRSGAHLAGLFGVEERAHVAVRVADHRELLVVHAVVRPRVVEALILLEHGPRVPHQRHVGRFPDGEAAAAEANRALEDRLRRVRVVDAGAADRDTQLALSEGVEDLLQRAVGRAEGREVLAEGGVGGHDAPQLLVLLEVAVPDAVPFHGRHHIHLAVHLKAADRVCRVDREETLVVLQPAGAVVDDVDAVRASCRRPVRQAQRRDALGGGGRNVDRHDGGILLQVDEDLRAVGGPGEVLGLELRDGPVRAPRGAEVERPTVSVVAGRVEVEVLHRAEGEGQVHSEADQVLVARRESVEPHL